MVFLGNLIAINDTKSKVGFIHNNPFDATDGMNMTQEELENIGILIDALPNESAPAGQQLTGIFVNPQTKEVFYEYAVPPKTDQERISDLETLILQLGGVI